MSKDIHHHITPPFAPIPPYDGHPHPFPHRHEAPRNHSARFRPMMLHPHIPHHFNFWCNKVIPLAYDDSLSYYEVLAKVADYLNNMLNDEKMMMINIEELAQAFCELQGFVNDYFAFYQSKGIINFEAAITNDNYLEILPDADNAQMNTVYRMQFVEGSTQNVPANLPESAKPYNHEAVLFNLSNFVVKRVGNEWLEVTDDNKEYSTKGNYQLFITGKNIYFRENNGDTWGEWNSVLDNWWEDKFIEVKDYIEGLLDELWAAIRAEVTRATAAEQVLDGKIEAETTRATTAEQGLSQRLVAEYERAAAKEAELEQAIEDETDRAEQVEGTLQTAIQTETTRATNAEAAIRTDLNAEITRATTRENQISADIADVARDLSEEIVDRQQADENLQDSITSVAQGLATETQRAQGVEQQLSSEVSTEVQRAQAAEQDIRDSYIPNLGNNVTGTLGLTRDSFAFNAVGANGGSFVVNTPVTYMLGLKNSAPLINASLSGGTALSRPIMNVGNASLQLYHAVSGAMSGVEFANGLGYYLNSSHTTANAGREIVVKDDIANFVTSSDIADFMPNEGNMLYSRMFTLGRSSITMNGGGSGLTDHGDITLTSSRAEISHLGGGYVAADGTNHRLEITQINGNSTLGSSIKLVGNNAYLYRTTAETSTASETSDYEIIRRSDIAGLAPSSALDNYIPNAGNSDTNIDFRLSRNIVTFNLDTQFIIQQSNSDRVVADGDGVKISGDNTNTAISVGYDTNVDIDIHAEDGGVYFVTDNINLQAADTGVTIGGDTDIKVYAGDSHVLTLESTDETNIKGMNVNIYAPDTNRVALSFGTGYDVFWFGQNAKISVYGYSLSGMNNFITNTIDYADGATDFNYEIANQTITISDSTTIGKATSYVDFETDFKFVGCTFNITNGSAIIAVRGVRIKFENCRFVAPNYVNNKVVISGFVNATFSNCTFENVDIECATNDNSSLFVVENCYCSHGLNLAPTVNPNAPIKIMNSYFDTESMTVPTGETNINALVGGCRFATGTNLNEIRHHWNNTNVGD